MPNVKGSLHSMSIQEKLGENTNYKQSGWSALNCVALLAWILILLPLSIDNFASVSVSHYDIRFTYLGAALGFALVGYTFLTDRSFRSRIFTWDSRTIALICFSALLIAGAFGAIDSANRTRSLLFLAWTAMTLLGLPVLVEFFYARFGKWLMRSLLTYGFAQAALVIFDFSACNISQGAFFLARVQTTGEELLCRPHAFYQEPSYFVGFAALFFLLAHLWLHLEKSRVWRSLCIATLLVYPIAVLCTFSKSGVLCAVVMCGLFLAQYFIGYLRGEGEGVVFQQKISGRAAIVGCLFFIGLPMLTLSANFYSFVKQINISFTSHFYEHDPYNGYDFSFNDRLKSLTASWRVFRENPVLGAGPGAAGAFIIERMPNDPYTRSLSNEMRVRTANDPLAQNVFTEVLSEWGILGMLFFIGGLLALYFPAPAWVKINILVLLGLTYAISQTLPRFDLWLLLSAIALLARQLGGRYVRPETVSL